MAPKSGSVSSGVDSGITLSRSDRDATLDGPKLAIAGVKDAMMVVANARVGSKSHVPDEILISMCWMKKRVADSLLPCISRLLSTHMRNGTWPFLCIWYGGTSSGTRLSSPNKFGTKQISL